MELKICLTDIGNDNADLPQADGVGTGWDRCAADCEPCVVCAVLVIGEANGRIFAHVP